MLRLKNPQMSAFPSGGWCFNEPKTNWRVAGAACFEQDYNGLATKIINHRLANKHIFKEDDAALFDRESVIQQIFQQKSATHPELFVGNDAVVVVAKKGSTTISPTTTCKKCGGNQFEPVFCRTCGGRKITGYKCNNCGQNL